MPLVGEGKVFGQALREGWLLKICPSISLPSGGFSNQSFRGLIADLSGGLLSLTFRQWFFVRQLVKEGRVVLAIGDLLPLFIAWSTGSKFGFIGTPKSDYTWRSGPGHAWSDYYHRLKGTEWDLWECSLMRSRRCKMVAVRDELTARSLRQHGVMAMAPGNPMMDGLQISDCPGVLFESHRVILLCGSRSPEAVENFQRLLVVALA